jgi:ubiquinone/menaquinone biosynthesis C-methylase UbiE
VTQPAGSVAQTYEDFYVAGVFRPWSGELIDRAQPRAGERILDLACGTGIISRLVAQRLPGHGPLSGLDRNPAMLEVARAVAAREGATIDWRLGSADDLPFADAAFDLVMIQQGLQFFPDRPAALAEVFRVLAPGGRLATATWSELARNPFNRALADAIARQLGKPEMDAPFSLGREPELRDLLTGAGFAGIVIERVGRDVRFPEPERYVEHRVASLTAGMPALQSMDDGQRAALVAGIRDGMAGTIQQYTVGSELVYRTEAHIATARKPA